MVFRGKITKCEDSDSGPKIFSANCRIDETLEDRELFQQRGFDSIPKESDDIIIIARGGFQIGICTMTDDRPNLNPGDAAISSSKKTYIKVGDNGEIEIISEAKKIFIDGDLTVSGKVEASGEVTANAKTIPIALSTHKHGTAVGPTTPPTP